MQPSNQKNGVSVRTIGKKESLTTVSTNTATVAKKKVAESFNNPSPLKKQIPSSNKPTTPKGNKTPVGKQEMNIVEMMEEMPETIKDVDLMNQVVQLRVELEGRDEQVAKLREINDTLMREIEKVKEDLMIYVEKEEGIRWCVFMQ